MIEIVLNDDTKHSVEMTGDEFKWDFQTEKNRIQSVYSALPFASNNADAIIDMIENLEKLDDIDNLISLLIRR